MRIENKMGRSFELQVTKDLAVGAFFEAELVAGVAAAIRNVSGVELKGELAGRLVFLAATEEPPDSQRIAVDDHGSGAGVPEDDSNGDGSISDGSRDFRIFNRTDADGAYREYDLDGELARQGDLPRGEDLVVDDTTRLNLELIAEGEGASFTLVVRKEPV